MSVFYLNPENALKRANEFLEIGKHGDAIECLHDVLKNRKSRLLKNTHEPIINKLLDICVEHKLSIPAKDGLYFYRIICQGINIMSWENAIKRLIFSADEKLRTARADNAYDATLLDKAINPEKLLQQNNGADNDCRSNLIVMSPWIKFMWECCRYCLELLKSTQSENFYHCIAQNAFQFCVQYSRKMEFRKLCNVIRTHLGYLHKRQNQLLLSENSQDTINLYLDTGIIQLNSALELELWSEAFKAIEDIHLVIGMLKKPANSKIIANYFKKLALVFWKANDLLHHAAALLRYFLLSRDLKKNLSSDDISSMASQSTLAILSVPFPPSNPAIDLIAETDATLIEKKNRLLSTLLNFSSNPIRKSLIKDLERYNVVQSAPLEIQNIFNVLENEADLRCMGEKCTGLITTINKWENQVDLKKYFPCIYNIAIVKVLVQVSNVYETITISKFTSLVPPVDVYEMETHIVESARRYDIPVRVDHRNKCLRFNSGFDLFQKEWNNLDEPATNNLLKDQTMNYLSVLYTSLNKIVNQIHPNENNKEINEEIKGRYLRTHRLDRKKMMERKQIIVKHKEKMKNMRLEKENGEKRLIVEKQLKYEAAEKERLLKEAEERAAQKRIIREQEIRKQILQEKMENLKKSQIGQLIENIELSELESLDTDVLLSKHIEKERKGFLTRMHRKERTTDHMERAKRLEEIPLLKQKYAIDKVISKEMWEQNEKKRIQVICEERARIVQNKSRLSVMKEDLEVFVDKIKESKKLDYEEECDSFRELLQQEREKRLKERSLKRKAERRLAWERQMKEVIRRKDHRSRKDEEPVSSNRSNSFVGRTAEKVPKYSCSRESMIQQARSVSHTRNQSERMKDTDKFQGCKSPKLQECKSPTLLNRNKKNMGNKRPLKESVTRRSFNPNELEKQPPVSPVYQMVKREGTPYVDDKIQEGYSFGRYSTSKIDDKISNEYYSRRDDSNSKIDYMKSNEYYSRRNDSNSKIDDMKSKEYSWRSDSNSKIDKVKTKEYSLWKNDSNSRRDPISLREPISPKQNYGSFDRQTHLSRNDYNSKSSDRILTEYSSYKGDSNSKIDNIKSKEYSLWGNQSYSKRGAFFQKEPVSPKKNYRSSDKQPYFSRTVDFLPSKTMRKEANPRFDQDYSLFRNPNTRDFLPDFLQATDAIEGTTRTLQPREESAPKPQNRSTVEEMEGGRFSPNEYDANEKQKFNVRRSCTPWAKMQRKEDPK